MKNIIPYISLYLILLVVVVVLLTVYPKAELHLLLNSYHDKLLDLFFRYYSTLAEWPLYVFAGISLVLFKIRWRWIAFYAACELTAALVILILKRFLDLPRPVRFFENLPQYHLPIVEGVHNHHHLSFPSGHTSTFFIFFTCCSLLAMVLHHHKSKGRLGLDKPSWLNRHKLFFVFFSFIVLAALGGYSRIYLSEHFLLDVSVGSIIGVTIPCLFYSCFSKIILK